ncbi:MAG: DMT family transporter [Rhizobiales bacterium]|nr:DMT family transporter [Hyphomicrobiales bacterium]
MGPAQWGMLTLLALLWGGSFFLAEIALNDVPPFTLVFCRVFLAALTLHIIVFASGKRMPGNSKIWIAFLGMGLLNNAIPFSLIFWGQTSITGGLASILNATTPLWTVLLAQFLTRDERMTPNKLVGVLIGFGGVALMLGPGLLGALGSNILAQAAILMAALSYGFAGIFGRRFQSIPPIMTATGQLTCSTILMLPVVAYMESPWQLDMPGLSPILAILFLAFFSTAFAYILFFKLLASAGAINLSLATFLVPVSAIVLGGLFLAETLTRNQVTGMLLIGLGLITIDGRLPRWVLAKMRRSTSS